MYNIAYICLGANDFDAEIQLDKAYDYLVSKGVVVKSTPVYPTDPEYAGDTAPYHNRIVVMMLACGYDEFVASAKVYERAVRAMASPGRVAVDIDVVVWNGTVMRPKDTSSRYYLKGLELLA